MVVEGSIVNYNRGSKAGYNLHMYCCNKGDLDSVDLLLRYGADINQVIKVVNKHGVITFRTPFSVSIGSADIDFVKYLVNKGANPTKAMNLFNEFIAKFVKKPLESNVRLIPTMGYREISVEIKRQTNELVLLNWGTAD